MRLNVFAFGVRSDFQKSTDATIYLPSSVGTASGDIPVFVMITLVIMRVHPSDTLSRGDAPALVCKCQVSARIIALIGQVGSV